MDLSDEETHVNGYLPQDIIFVILLHLPAEFLWTVARHVCKAWANIISDRDFVNAHYLKSKDGLLVQEFTGPYFMQYLAKEDRTFRATTTGANFAGLGIPINSCRGLCIFISGAIIDSKNILIVHVANPMTRQVLRLPYLGRHLRYKFIKLLYIAPNMDYVAACLVADGSDLSLFTFSLGTDVFWRKLSYIPRRTLKTLSCLCVEFNRSGSFSVAQNRNYVVAAGGSIYAIEDLTTITMINLLEETVSYIRFPHGQIYQPFGILERGDSISFMTFQKCILHVWMLKGAEWVHVCQIDNARVVAELSGLCSSPIGWLDNWLIFANKKLIHFWMYDVDNAETRAFTLNHGCFWHNSQIHRNSLIRW